MGAARACCSSPMGRPYWLYARAGGQQCRGSLDRADSGQVNTTVRTGWVLRAADLGRPLWLYALVARGCLLWGVRACSSLRSSACVQLCIRVAAGRAP